MSILSVDDLSVSFGLGAEAVPVVEKINLVIERGEILGLVGESGSGKSVTALALMGLLPQPSGKMVSGSVLIDGQHVKPEQARGQRIAMIFQEPMTALNPVHSVGKQLLEVFQLSGSALDKQARYKKAIEWLNRVGIPEPEQRMSEYPHQLSGGMRQRVMIAMALAAEPDILIADEPTTALDVTIQGQILSLIKKLQSEINMGVLFITHDLGVVFNLCDRVAVMYAGGIVESGEVAQIFRSPLHPYTQGLLASIPTLDSPRGSPLPTIEGSVPAPGSWPPGCRFAPRCQYRTDECSQPSPSHKAKPSHQVACHHWETIND